MNTEFRWDELYRQEIQQAENARRIGNHGMSRVCARRAAGIVVGEYFAQQGIEFNSTSAYERLVHLNSLNCINSQLKEVLAHFLIHVTPDFELPVEADLLLEVDWLKNQLLDE